MAERMGVSGWSGVLGTWVSIVGVFGGGVAALNTYGEEVAKMEDARVVQTFALFEMFSSAERLQARQRILDAANSRTEYEGHDLWITLDFYDALQVCVERNLCDQDLAVRLFQPYAVPIWNGLSSDIVSGRTPSDPNMGAGIEWMASLPLSEGAAVTLEVAEPAAPDSLTTEVAPVTSDALAETPSE
ncbi:MAG: hypothetical protein K2P70_15955 [Hyphomonadaceae bacterium]|nr:hypothetical protein [Hyphomonadaceae bacterium]